MRAEHFSVKFLLIDPNETKCSESAAWQGKSLIFRRVKITFLGGQCIRERAFPLFYLGARVNLASCQNSYKGPIYAPVKKYQMTSSIGTLKIKRFETF
jgi:hypothetical protein